MTQHDDLLDLVNDADEVIGTARFSEVHAELWLHRFCRVLVFNAAGEVVLHRRVGGRKAGVWDSAGGHLVSGENYEQGAARELLEEMGITADLHPLMGLMRFFDPGYENMHGRVFTCTHAGPYAESDESAAFQAFAPAEVSRMLVTAPETFAGQLQEAWRVYTEHQMTQGA